MVIEPVKSVLSRIQMRESSCSWKQDPYKTQSNFQADWYIKTIGRRECPKVRTSFTIPKDLQRPELNEGYSNIWSSTSRRSNKNSPSNPGTCKSSSNTTARDLNNRVTSIARQIIEEKHVKKAVLRPHILRRRYQESDS